MGTKFEIYVKSNSAAGTTKVTLDGGDARFQTLGAAFARATKEARDLRSEDAALVSLKITSGDDDDATCTIGPGSGQKVRIGHPHR